MARVTNSRQPGLLAEEQVGISESQIAFSAQKEEQTAQLLKAGRSNGLFLQSTT